MKHTNAHKIYSDAIFPEIKLEMDLCSSFDRFDFEQYVAPSARDREKCIEICDGLIDILCALFNVSGQQMRSAKRQCNSVAHLRQIGIYLAHVSLGLNLTMVATGFCRTKSTVVHSCRTIEDMRDDVNFDRFLERIERIVYVAFGSK